MKKIFKFDDFNINENFDVLTDTINNIKTDIFVDVKNALTNNITLNNISTDETEISLKYLDETEFTNLVKNVLDRHDIEYDESLFVYFDVNNIKYKVPLNINISCFGDIFYDHSKNDEDYSKLKYSIWFNFNVATKV
jgi:hypothetical protein